ncbi:MAG: TIM barrel protein [Candidatus Woesearchaeota archaeon]
MTNKDDIMAEYFRGKDPYFGRMPQEYFSSLDREVYSPIGSVEGGEPILEMSEIGTTAAPFEDQLQNLKKRIFQGAAKVELGFSGTGKGFAGRGSITPEMYGREHREAIRDIAQLNQIELSTHTSIGVGNLSGLQQNGFSDEAREAAYHEIQRTVDFASDVTRGGAIVVHTGEYERPLAGKYDKFSKYEDEADKAMVMLVNKKTGEIAAYRKDQDFYWPEMEIDENGRLKTDNYGSFIPKYDPESRKFKMKAFDDDDANRVVEYFKSQGRDIKPEQARYFAQLESRKRNAEAWSQQQASDVQSTMKDLEALYKDKELLEEQWDSLTDFQKKIWKDQILSMAGRYVGGAIERNEFDARQIVDDAIRKMEASVKYSRDVSTNYMQEAMQSEEQIKNLEMVEDYALGKTADTLARAGMYALEKSNRMRSQGQLDKPLYISPENIFPESYGGHPDELKRIVLESRKKMTDMLVEKKSMSEEQAKKIAQDHIKATFDIGHANIWRKYYKGSDEEFNQWLLSKAEELASQGIIGHVHITDNFGYHDEHLSTGEGNAPIREFAKIMKKHGVNDVIVETAHQDFDATKAAWRQIAGEAWSSFDIARSDRWTNIENSYFGRVSGPYFMVGEYAPNPEAYQFWTQTKLE